MKKIALFAALCMAATGPTQLSAVKIEGLTKKTEKYIFSVKYNEETGDLISQYGAPDSKNSFSIHGTVNRYQNNYFTIKDNLTTWKQVLKNLTNELEDMATDHQPEEYIKKQHRKYEILLYTILVDEDQNKE